MRKRPAGVGAVRVPDLERNEFGTPLVSEIFRSGREHGQGRVLTFLNADIILPPLFAQAVAIVERNVPAVPASRTKGRPRSRSAPRV